MVLITMYYIWQTIGIITTLAVVHYFKSPKTMRKQNIEVIVHGNNNKVKIRY